MLFALDLESYNGCLPAAMPSPPVPRRHSAAPLFESFRGHPSVAVLFRGVPLPHRVCFRSVGSGFRLFLGLSAVGGCLSPLPWLVVVVDDGLGVDVPVSEPRVPSMEARLHNRD